jgi:hypothetical protein
MIIMSLAHCAVHHDDSLPFSSIAHLLERPHCLGAQDTHARVLRLRIQGALEHDGIQGSMKLQASRNLGVQAKGFV